MPRSSANLEHAELMTPVPPMKRTFMGFYRTTNSPAGNGPFAFSGLD